MIEVGAILAAFQPLIPITVLAAVVLFLVKEMLEWVKRHRADSRKLAAIKRLVSRDIEVNGWVMRSYRHVLMAMAALDREPGQHMRIRSLRSGRLHYESWEGEEDDEGIKSSGMFPSPVSVNVEKYLLDAATLDRRLLVHMEAASTALAEMEHVRLSAMEHIDDTIHRAGFITYAGKVLDKAETDLTALYRYCTGRTEIIRRVR